MIRKYISREKRKAASRRMLAGKQAKRERLGVDADTLRWRALHPMPAPQKILDLDPGKAEPGSDGRQE